MVIIILWSYHIMVIMVDPLEYFSRECRVLCTFVVARGAHFPKTFPIISSAEGGEDGFFRCPQEASS